MAPMTSANRGDGFFCMNGHSFVLLLFASYNNHNTGVEKRPLFASVGGNKLKTLLVSLNAKYIHTALGLYSIAASCREQGNTVAVKEYTINQDLLMVLADIAGQSPDVVGFAGGDRSHTL